MRAGSCRSWSSSQNAAGARPFQRRQFFVVEIDVAEPHPRLGWIEAIKIAARNQHFPGRSPQHFVADKPRLCSADRPRIYALGLKIRPPRQAGHLEREKERLVATIARQKQRVVAVAEHAFPKPRMAGLAEIIGGTFAETEDELEQSPLVSGFWP